MNMRTEHLHSHPHCTAHRCWLHHLHPNFTPDTSLFSFFYDISCRFLVLCIPVQQSVQVNEENHEQEFHSTAVGETKEHVEISQFSFNLMIHHDHSNHNNNHNTGFLYVKQSNSRGCCLFNSQSLIMLGLLTSVASVLPAKGLMIKLSSCDASLQ